MINIYLLERIGTVADHGEAAAFVVAAGSEDAARQAIVTENVCGQEGSITWREARYSRCTLIGLATAGTQRGVVLRDYAPW
jgi:hypothetical protein